MIGAWDGIDEFVAVAEAGSFTAAADAFGASVTHMSRAVGRLENRIAVQLFNRTTRSVRLTDSGGMFLEQCRRMIMDRDEAIGLISDSNAPRGELRCTCSTALGERFLVPILMRYGVLYPEVNLHIELTNRLVDLVAEGYDLALRTGHFDDSRLAQTKVASRTFYTCASPEYLDKAGRPVQVDDLSEHACLMGSGSTWHFSIGGKERIMRPKPVWRCNSGVSVHQAALAGMGICQLPEFYVIDAINDGRLELVLDEYRAATEPIWAVYPQRRYLPSKTSHLLDMLHEELPRLIG